MSITTAMATSFKQQIMGAVHCIATTQVPTANLTSTDFTAVSMSSLAGLSVGMSIAGTGVPSGTVLASIDSSSQITMSKAATATNTGVTLTISGDTYNGALFVGSGMTGSYGASTNNYSVMTGNSDETSGTGYTAGGAALTVSVGPTISGTGAYMSYSNLSWTSATFSTLGLMIYNTNTRQYPSGACTSVYDFGGAQSVSGGTFTVIMPTPGVSTSVLSIQ